MNLLAFDTSTEMMSIGVSRTVDGRTQQWLHTGAGGAQASTGLIAGVLDLMAQAGLALSELDAIGFGSGPGSFTGLRTACSVAQGLAFGANVPVLPIESLLAVAEEARFTAMACAPSVHITAMLDARMDELYAASYACDGGQWTEQVASHLVKPENLSAAQAQHCWAGNVFAAYGARLPGSDQDGTLRITALPSAAAMLRLAPQLLAQGRAVHAAQALPVYIRDKVAKTTLERATEKVAALVGVSGA